MKILFASDMSFNFIENCPEEQAVKEAMSEVSSLFEDADYSIVNLENIFGDKEAYKPIPKSGPNLISDDSFARYIEVLNPSVVGLANNHTGDFGEDAILHTIDVLREKGYPCIGAGETIDDAYRPYLIDHNGVRIGIIAVCENEFGCAKATKAGAAGYSLSLVKEKIKKLEEIGYMSVIYFHGGNEYNPFPSPGKKELYRHFIDIGASAVVAMHTHCPQGFEIYDGKPIVYSMGNFYFPAGGSLGSLKSWSYGYMTQLEFTKDQILLTTVPYYFDLKGICLLKGEELDDFNNYLHYISGVIQDDLLLREYFESWCAYRGNSYSRFIQFEEDYLKDNSKKVAETRNIFYCEAHCEMIKEFLQLCYENRLEEAKYRLEEIKRLQNMEI